MARYYQKPQSPIVDLTPQYPAEFYSKLIEQAQQNLNQGTAAGNAFMADAYGQEFIDQVARDKAMALAQDPIAKALDKDFVTNANIASAVGQASKAIAPWKNINKVHLEQAKREQALRDRLGANYIGNSVMNKSVMNPDGTYVNADDLNVVASNREDLQKALERDLADRKTKIRTKDMGMSLTPDGKFYKYGSKTIRGITEQEWADEFANNPEIAKLYASQMPELTAAIKASGQSPEEFLQNEIGNITKQWVQGEVTDYNYMNNPSWTPGGYTPDTENFNPLSYQEMTESGEDVDNYLDKWGTKEFGMLRHLGKGLGQKASLTKGYVRTNKEEFEDQANKLNPELLKQAYKLYPDNQNKAVDYFVDELYKERLAYQRGDLNLKGRSLKKSTSWDINISDSDNGIVRAMVMSPLTEISSEDGKHKTTLGAAAKAKSLVRVRDDGKLIVTDAKNKYVWDVTDPEILSTLPTQVQKIVTMQKALSDDRWSSEVSSGLYETGVSDRYYKNGQPTEIVGRVAYRVEPSNNKNANKIIKMIITDKVDANGEPFWVEEEVDFDEVSKISSIALMKILQSEKMPSVNTSATN